MLIQYSTLKSYYFPYTYRGLSLALLSGTMYGFQFLPIELLRRCDHDAFSCIG